MDTEHFSVDPDSGLRVEIAGQRATIVLARPERLNCQSPLTWSELARVHSSLPGSVRVVVLRAEGRAFSAGLDRALVESDARDGIRQLAQLSREEATARIAGWQGAFDWSSRADVVSVCAVQGHAIGGGFQLALGADIRVLADDALFCMAEPTLGIVPDLGGTKRLVELVGYSRAAEICLTGRRVDADESLRIGLASHVVPRDRLEAATDQLVDALLAVDRDAAAETKALLAAADGRSQAAQEAAEADAQYRRLRSLAGLDAED